MYIYMHSVPFFNTNSTIMPLWWLDWSVLVILKIYWYVYAFCIVGDVNSTVMIRGVCAVIRMTCFGFITTEQKWNVNYYSFLFGMTWEKSPRHCYKNIAFKFIKISKYWLFIDFLLTDHMHWVHRCL